MAPILFELTPGAYRSFKKEVLRIFSELGGITGGYSRAEEAGALTRIVITVRGSGLHGPSRPMEYSTAPDTPLVLCR